MSVLFWVALEWGCQPQGDRADSQHVKQAALLPQPAGTGADCADLLAVLAELAEEKTSLCDPKSECLKGIRGVTQKRGAQPWQWREAHLTRCVFPPNANLSCMSFDAADMSHATLPRDVVLMRTSFLGTLFDGAIMDDVKMVNEEGRALFGFNHRGLGPSFRGVRAKRTNFSDMLLNRADFRGAELEGADFDAAELEYARFNGANLRKAQLIQAHLEGADLRGADLRGANLYFAELYKADLRGAKTEGANLDEAFFDSLKPAASQENLPGR